MAPIPPFWFRQRQSKMEEAGPDIYRLTGPNLAEAFISVRKADDGRWAGLLKGKADGPDLAATEATFERPEEAWEAAFELYRRQFVV